MENESRKTPRKKGRYRNTEREIQEGFEDVHFQAVYDDLASSSGGMDDYHLPLSSEFDSEMMVWKTNTHSFTSGSANAFSMASILNLYPNNPCISTGPPAYFPFNRKRFATDDYLSNDVLFAFKGHSYDNAKLCCGGMISFDLDLFKFLIPRNFSKVLRGHISNAKYPLLDNLHREWDLRASRGLLEEHRDVLYKTYLQSKFDNYSGLKDGIPKENYDINLNCGFSAFKSCCSTPEVFQLADNQLPSFQLEKIRFNTGREQKTMVKESTTTLNVVPFEFSGRLYVHVCSDEYELAISCPCDGSLLKKNDLSLKELENEKYRPFNFVFKDNGQGQKMLTNITVKFWNPNATHIDKADGVRYSREKFVVNFHIKEPGRRANF